MWPAPISALSAGLRRVDSGLLARLDIVRSLATKHQLFALRHLDSSKLHKQPRLTVLVDLKRACDSVQHLLVSVLLARKGVHGTMLTAMLPS